MAISGLTGRPDSPSANVGGEGCSLKLKPTVTASLTFTLAGTDANITGVNAETGVDVNWTDHGFKAGDSITISGLSINDGKTYTIASISARRQHAPLFQRGFRGLRNQLRNGGRQ